MQMNQATVLAILAFTTSSLAQWDSYSYGNELYAREAMPEYEEYDLYAREASPEYEEEEEFSQLSAREEAYLDAYYSNLARRAPPPAKAPAASTDPLKKIAAADTKDATKLNKAANDEKLKADHDKHAADLAKANVAEDKASIDILLKKLKEFEGKMKTDKEAYRQKRKQAHAEAKKAKDLKTQADDKTREAKVLSARELLEEYYGYELDY